MSVNTVFSLLNAEIPCFFKLFYIISTEYLWVLDKTKYHLGQTEIEVFHNVLLFNLEMYLQISQ